MRRENKLALIVGFSVLLVVAVLVSDHLSQARQDEIEDGLEMMAKLPENGVVFNVPFDSDGRVGLRDRIDMAGAESRLDQPQGLAQAPPQRQARAASADPSDRTADPRRASAQPIQTVERVAPVEIYNGAGSEIARSGGSNNAIGIDTGALRELLRQRNRPVLAQPGSKAKDQPKSARAEQPSATRTVPSIKGHVPRDNKYVVQPNDTLYEICEMFYGDGMKWRELAAINKGKVGENGTVYPGIALDLLDGTAVKVPQATRARDSEPVSKTAEADTTRRYTVKKGDTLSQIVQREVGSVRHLDRVRALNPWLKDQKDNVRIGQKLTLPVMRHASALGR